MVESPWDMICRGAPFFRILLGVLVFLLLLTVVTFPSIAVGTPEYYLTLVNFVVLGVGTTGAVVVIYVCRRRADP